MWVGQDPHACEALHKQEGNHNADVSPEELGVQDIRSHCPGDLY